MAGIDTSNWLQRRSAGLVFEASFSPLDPDEDDLLVDYDNLAPEYIYGYSRSMPYTEHIQSFARHYFDGYSKRMVKKIRGTGEIYSQDAPHGTLTLATRRTYYYGVNQFGTHFFGDYNGVSAAMGLDAPLLNGLISDSNVWTGGENKLHVSATTYQNIPAGFNEDDPPKPLFRNIIINHSFDYSTGGKTDSLVSDEVTTQRVGTTYLPFAGNGSTWYGQEFEDQEFFAQFSGGLVEYTDATPTSVVAPFYYRIIRPRLDEQEPLGVPEYLPALNSTSIDGDLQYWNTPIDRLMGFYTFKGQPSWVATNGAAKVNVSCKFVFQAPDTCKDCWYEGTTVELKIKYKQATLSRVFVAGTSTDAGGFYTTVGTLSDHSEVTKNITLPGKGATPTTWQDVGDVFEMPQEEGKLIVIDDMELVSITLPGDPAP